MGMVHAYKQGKLKDASEEVKKIAASMKDDDAKDFAKTKHEGLPSAVEKAAFLSGYSDGYTGTPKRN